MSFLLPLCSLQHAPCQSQSACASDRKWLSIMKLAESHAFARDERDNCDKDRQSCLDDP
jgi:hypothetical protein